MSRSRKPRCPAGRARCGEAAKAWQDLRDWLVEVNVWPARLEQRDCPECGGDGG